MNTNTSFCMQIEKEEKKPFEEKRERERGEREMRIVFCWSNRLLLLTRRHTEREKKKTKKKEHIITVAITLFFQNTKKPYAMTNDNEEEQQQQQRKRVFHSSFSIRSVLGEDDMVRMKKNAFFFSLDDQF